MFLSVFDMFKVGIGPSSSHTMGPMVAAARFLDTLRASPFHFHGLKASLHGSLAFTGVGHATDRATILGLAGFEPATYDADKAEVALARIKETKQIEAPGLGTLAFDPAKDLLFDYGPALPGHANGMILRATDAQGDVIFQETYYSIGGGFVLTAAELAEAGGAKSKARADVPYPFESAAEMLEMAKASGLTVAQMKRANELKFRSAAELDAGINRIWQVMNDCISRGMKGEGILPGGLKVRRRAKGIHDALLAERGLNLTPPHTINDWMSLYAMAGHEEDAPPAYDQRRDVVLCKGGERENRGGRPGRPRPHQRGGRRGSRRHPLLAGPCARRFACQGRGFSSDRFRDRRALQAQRFDLGGRMRLSGRSGVRRCHGRRGFGRRSGWLPGTGGKRRRDSAGTSPRHDLRSREGPRAGALHRKERAWRDQGGFGGLAVPARRRPTPCQP